MAEPEKKKAGLGDLIALGIGAGLIAYFTQIRGNPKYASPTNESWLDAALVVIPAIIALGVATYFVNRLLGAVMVWARRQRVR